MEMKISVVFGTRPEIIKLAPVIKEFQKCKKNKNIRLCVINTAQHREMSDEFLHIFDIKPDYDLNIMEENQTPQKVMVNVFEKLGKIFEEEKPHWIIVQGDTTTAFAAALLAFFNKFKIAHVEAGLRTYDKYQPFPEEINRRLIAPIADLHFCPTKRAKENLLREGIDEKTIIITGNTVIDSLKHILQQKKIHNTEIKKILNHKKYILITAHRRENFTKGLENICKAVNEIAKKYREYLLIFIVHPNPIVKKVVYSTILSLENIKLLKPLNYVDFIYLMSKASFIMTDSGGIQEEAISLRKYVFVLRNKTERQELIEVQCGKVIGCETENIINQITDFINKNEHKGFTFSSKNPFGDGNAAKRIVNYFLTLNEK